MSTSRILSVAVLASGFAAALPAAAQSVCAEPSFVRPPGSFGGGPGQGGYSSFHVGGSPMSATVADFDRDGQLDIATANLGGDSVSVRFGNNNPIDGNFNQRAGVDIAMPASPGTNGSRPYGITHGLMNNDAFVDLVVVNRNSNTAVVLLGDGSGGFTQLAPAAIGGGYAYHPALGDFDGDGDLDVAATQNAGNFVRILINDGQGVLSPHPTTLGGINAPIGIVAGDMLGSSAVDLAVVASGSDQVYVYPGNGNGTFAAPTILDAVENAIATPISVQLHDMDNDGRGDLVVAVRVNRANGGEPVSPYNRIAIFHSLPGGGFESTPLFIAAGPDMTHATAADFDRDGHLDLLGTSAAFAFIGNVVLNSGARTYDAPIGHDAAGNPFFGVTGDFNQSGYPDFAIVNQPSNTVTVYINQCAPTDPIFDDGFDAAD
jgi:hypothetical protein